QLRRRIHRSDRYAISIPGHVYLRSSDRDLMSISRHLVQVWKRPDTTIRRAGRVAPGAWVDVDSAISRTTNCVGPVWIGAGRQIPDNTSIVGPTVLWDNPESRPAVEMVQW